MRLKYALIIAFIIGMPKVALSEMLGNPGTQVGEKNLFVGVEYSSTAQIFDLDTEDLDTISDKITLKVTTGLTEWLDIYFRAGGAKLKLDYKKGLTIPTQSVGVL